MWLDVFLMWCIGTCTLDSCKQASLTSTLKKTLLSKRTKVQCHEIILREKLSMAVKKGKGLVHERDTLKQQMA